jgi:hypothetical protein
MAVPPCNLRYSEPRHGCTHEEVFMKVARERGSGDVRRTWPFTACTQ